MQVFDNPNLTFNFLPVSEKLWFTPDGLFPPDEPQCGFQGDKCINLSTLSVGTLVAVIVVPVLALIAMAVAAGFAVVKLRYNCSVCFRYVVIAVCYCSCIYS